MRSYLIRKKHIFSKIKTDDTHIFKLKDKEGKILSYWVPVNVESLRVLKVSLTRTMF